MGSYKNCAKLIVQNDSLSISIVGQSIKSERILFSIIKCRYFQRYHFLLCNSTKLIYLYNHVTFFVSIRTFFAQNQPLELITVLRLCRNDCQKVRMVLTVVMSRRLCLSMHTALQSEEHSTSECFVLQHEKHITTSKSAESRRSEMNHRFFARRRPPAPSARSDRSRQFHDLVIVVIRDLPGHDFLASLRGISLSFCFDFNGTLFRFE